jgi:pyruvate/2-oxoglutarate dehydrogenase complex dihydrolipoamide acyltransferase (E2) component
MSAPPSVVERDVASPYVELRRVIAEHMARAHREVPPVTWVEECDFEDVPLDRLCRSS